MARLSVRMQLFLLMALCQTMNVCGMTSVKSNAVVRLNKRQTVLKHVVKRALPTTVFTPSEIQVALDIHNKYRGGEGAADMRYMIWNDALASMAQAWADTCNFEHGQPTENPSGYSFLGQNLFATSSSVFESEAQAGAVTAWFNEKRDYDFNSNGCRAGKVCGHYTQIVWSSSFEVGCGATMCSPITGTSFGSGWLYVCNYGPAGNVDGQKPYKKGEPCTKCSSGLFHCYDGKLCRDGAECASSGASCGCNAATACQNCAKVNTDCSCSCADGYSGVSCADPCKNFHSSCGANPGWPAYWCNDQYPYVLTNCPLMCGLCNVTTPNSPPCDNAPAPISHSLLNLLSIIIIIRLFV